MEIQDVEEANSQKTWIMCPPNTDQILDLKLPILVAIIKSLQSSLLIQLQIVDKNNVRHLINLSNVQPKKTGANNESHKNPTANTNNNNRSGGPLKAYLLLESGWNRLEIDIGQLSKIFGTTFVAVTRLKISANCRLRRLYFLDKHYNYNDLSLAMYHGFMDSYMSKWGIRMIERATQTKKTLAKPGKDALSLPFVNTFNKLFLKNLQTKADKTIDDRLSRHPSITIKDYIDFKKKAKIKPYVIPDRNKFKLKKNSESNVDLQEIRRYFTRDDNLFEKLTFEDKINNDDDKKKSVDTTTTTTTHATTMEPEEKTIDPKQEVRNLMYKVYRYRYPSFPEKKETKHEALKYSVIKKM